MTRHLTVDDLAERWRTTPKAVYAMRHRGELPPAVRVGRRLLWTTSAVEEFEGARVEAGAGVRAAPRSTRGPRPAVTKSYANWFKEKDTA